jgi:myo-inositol 2-dehydrogenase/D-chiro-inositol 1-dehydrogenase
MRVALIGAGRIGRLHGTNLMSHPEVRQVAISDVDPARARLVAAEIGGRAVRSPEEALDTADAVVIAASTDAHATLVRSAVERGIPTFCEKPLAFDLAETVALVDEIEHANVPVQVGFQRRFDPAYREARRLVESGELGIVYLVRLIAHDHEPPPEAYIATSGGLFRDSSIHDFDAIRWVTGQEVDEIYATGSVRAFDAFARHGDIDTGAAILRLADGTLGVLGQTRHDARGYDIRMEVVGSRDSVTVGLGPRTPIRSLEPDATAPSDPAWVSFLDRFAAAYREEIHVFLRVARGEIPSPCTASDALEAMRTSLAAARSLAEHRPVRVAEVT